MPEPSRMNALNPLRTFDEIRTRSAGAVVSQAGLNHEGLSAEIRRKLSSTEAAEGGLLQEPVVEGAPGYVRDDATLQDMSGTLLHPDTVAALDGGEGGRKGRYRFRRTWRPFAHQVAAWHKLAEPEANSVLVTSGTGSGKTECFLVPIIDDLVRQSRSGPLDEGVQAIVLYPLNALIASQEERLRDWTAPFDGRVRFALYNGLLPNEVGAREAQARPETVPDRASLRRSPPPILVTNVTMLEYMLLRPEDAPILRKSAGKLRYVVLDEAHSYIGARAAEIALLLRRVCLAFGTDPKDVRFVATSATIGGPDASADLARFLADVSGAPTDRVSVIKGEPHWPKLPPMTRAGSLDEDLMIGGDPGALYDLLSAHRVVRPLLERLRAGAVTMSEVAAVAAKAEVTPAALAQGLSRARDKDDVGLSPLRIHAFHRAVAGLWSCIDPGCTGPRPAQWPFGALQGDDVDRCRFCGGHPFEVVACNACGEPYLKVVELEDGSLTRSRQGRVDDDFAADAEATGDAGGGELDDDDAGNHDTDDRDPIRLILWRPLAGTWPLHVDVKHARACGSPSPDLTTFRCVSDEHTDRCVACGTRQKPGSTEVIRPFRFGAPFLLGNLVPELLQGTAAAEHDGPRDRLPPLEGRQLLSFTDSRQGTARISAKLQIGAERNFVRSFVYHAVQDALLRSPDTSKFDEQIAKFEGLISAHPGLDLGLDGVLATARADRAAKLREAASGLAWPTMVQRLAEREEIGVWLRELWSRRDPERFGNPTVLANFLLLRELSRRPKQANSIETMGLARLRFDAIDAAVPPKAFRDLGGGDPDWRDYLDILQTHVVRGNSAVRMDWNDRRWIDHKTLLKRLVKKADAEPVRGQYRWPSVPQGDRPLGNPSRAVWLLLKGLVLDPRDPMVRVALQECLDAAWTAMRSILSPPGAVDHALDFTTANVGPVTRADVCPVTRRVLDASFRGLTPYDDPDPASEARKVTTFEMPRHPAPFLGVTDDEDRDVARAKVAAWLADDPTIRELRGRGVWNNLTDKTASFADYFRSAEHSAQQAPKRLRHYEALFKEGNINVLNCSTTMEMGVDIGSVSHVLMTNVPPSIASYRQRVGRAGRRNQAMSMAFTFCKDRPLDRMAFLEPIRFLARTMRAPRVALDSTIIVQRHVNALLFSAYVHGQQTNALKTQAGPFFGCPSGAGAIEDIDNNGAALFSAFVRLPSTRAALAAQVAALTRGSALDRDAGVFDAAAKGMDGVREAFAAEWRALQASRSKGKAAAGSEAANKGLVIRLRRMCEDYVLGVLSGRGFLPSHGFPTGVVPFVCPLDEIEEERPEDRSRRAKPYPQRQLDVAMREYAPGAEVVLDGLVHKSAGVTLNWRRPASEDGVREIQNLLWRWDCRSCGESGTTRTMDDVEACKSCGAAAPDRFEYLQPAGFAADWRDDPHANPDVISYVPPEEPRIGLGGARWSPLANPAQGRRRENSAGTVFHCSSGPGRKGYEICLHCGRAQAEAGDLERIAWDHKPLFGKADRSDACTGSDSPFGIKRELRLGYDVSTDVFEVQPNGISTRGSGLAFAVALREALARRLGIGMEEMGVAASRRDKASGGPISCFVFDRAVGGSGFSTQAGPLFDELLREMASILDCKAEGCVGGCPACVLSGDLTDDQARILDREGALAVTLRLAAEGTPDAQDLAAPGARLTPDAFDALLRARTSTATRLVLRVSSPLDVETMSEWGATALIRRWTDTGGTAVVSVLADALASMGGTAKLALRDWLMTWGAGLEESADAKCPNGALVLAEVVGSAGSVVLATRDAALLGAGPTWGRPDDTSVVQFNAAEEKLRGVPVALDRLQPSSGAKIKTLENELNGNLGTFGRRMVQVMRTALREAGVADGAIASVTYSDRYLNSPLTARMAIETLAVLTGSAPGKSVKARLEMSSLRPKDKWSTALDDDWTKENDRQEVMLQYAGRLGLQLTTWRGKVPHGRCMEIEFAAGHSARIYMDQGFGAWEVQSPPLYPFTEGAQKQVAAMIVADPRVTARGPTYIAAEAR